MQGIYPSGAGDLVQNNISYHNAGSGITFNHNNTGASIAGNLSFANANHGISISSGGGSGDNFVLSDNITRDNKLYGINVHGDANGAHNQYRNNLFLNNGKGRYGLDNGTGEWNPPNASGTVAADPKMVDYQPDGTGDYHLTAGSPAIDAGTDLGAAATDFDGVARPQGAGYDIGPFEYQSQAPPSTPPSSPSTAPSGDGAVVGFEDGTTAGWSSFYGGASPAVTTDIAYMPEFHPHPASSLEQDEPAARRPDRSPAAS